MDARQRDRGDRGEKERERETERDTERESARIKVIECLTGKFKGEQSANSYETDTQGADIPPNGIRLFLCDTSFDFMCQENVVLSELWQYFHLLLFIIVIEFAGKSKSAVFGSMSDLISLHGKVTASHVIKCVSVFLFLSSLWIGLHAKEDMNTSLRTLECLRFWHIYSPELKSQIAAVFCNFSSLSKLTHLILMELSLPTGACS